MLALFLRQVLSVELRQFEIANQFSDFAFKTYGSGIVAQFAGKAMPLVNRGGDGRRRVAIAYLLQRDDSGTSQPFFVAGQLMVKLVVRYSRGDHDQGFDVEGLGLGRVNTGQGHASPVYLSERMPGPSTRRA